MIPLTFLYDEYIDRPKLTEQKKPPFQYIVPPPHKWGRNKKPEFHQLNNYNTIVLKLKTNWMNNVLNYYLITKKSPKKDRNG